MFHGVATSLSKYSPTSLSKYRSGRPWDKADMRNLAIIAIALCCVVMPLEISQLLFALLGALGYLLLQYLQPSVEEARGKSAKSKRSLPLDSRVKSMPAGRQARPVVSRQAGAASPTQTVQPVVPPIFNTVGFQAEVDEFLGQIAPSVEGDAVVAQIARRVKQSIRHIIPEAEVAGFASGNVLSSGAFGVAVPEVDIVISAGTSALQGRLMCKGSQGGSGGYTLDGVKLKKSAIRAITDRLVGSGAFKFRRSAFRGEEPKVILIAPAVLGKYEITVPVSVSVNAATPMCSAVLVTECGRKDPRSQALILLVRRWAKDRGLSHVTKGHFSPYAWTLLTIYFLQVDGGEEGPLLPSLDAFEKSSTLPGTWLRSDTERATEDSPRGANGKRSVAALFQDFLYFYKDLFDWRREAVSVRLGQRAAPDASLPLHIILETDGHGSAVGPSVEDPFAKGCNVGDCMTAESFSRLQEEFSRAALLCSRDVSLTELLQPWVPPDVHTADAV